MPIVICIATKRAIGSDRTATGMLLPAFSPLNIVWCPNRAYESTIHQWKLLKNPSLLSAGEEIMQNALPPKLLWALHDLSGLIELLGGAFTQRLLIWPIKTSIWCKRIAMKSVKWVKWPSSIWADRQSTQLSHSLTSSVTVFIPNTLDLLIHQICSRFPSRPALIQVMRTMVAYLLGTFGQPWLYPTCPGNQFMIWAFLSLGWSPSPSSKQELKICTNLTHCRHWLLPKSPIRWQRETKQFPIKIPEAQLLQFELSWLPPQHKKRDYRSPSLSIILTV